MSVWSLAESGCHGDLCLGDDQDSVEARFGEPDDVGAGGKIWKYDDVELHFDAGELYLVHCEFGSLPPVACVKSDRLRLEADGLSWPLSKAGLIAMAEEAGFALAVVELAWGVEVKFGLARMLFAEEDEIVTWSITTAGSSR